MTEYGLVREQKAKKSFNCYFPFSVTIFVYLAVFEKLWWWCEGEESCLFWHWFESLPWRSLWVSSQTTFCGGMQHAALPWGAKWVTSECRKFWSFLLLFIYFILSTLFLFQRPQVCRTQGQVEALLEDLCPIFQKNLQVWRVQFAEMLPSFFAWLSMQFLYMWHYNIRSPLCVIEPHRIISSQ